MLGSTEMPSPFTRRALRATGFGLVVLGAAIATLLTGCADDDGSADLRAAIANESVPVRGTIDVHFLAFGRTFTPRYTIEKGFDDAGPYRRLVLDPSKPVVAPVNRGDAKQGAQGRAPLGRLQIENRVRTNEVSPGFGARTMDPIVAIDDVDAFLEAHRVTRVAGDGDRVAGRDVITLVATPTTPSGLHYRIRIDRVRPYVLGIEERDSSGRLLHAVSFRSITFGVAPPPKAQRFRTPRERLTPAQALRAANALQIPVEHLFPVGAPAGFESARIIRSDDDEGLHLRFTNGTTTGVVLVYLRGPRPASPARRARVLDADKRRDLVLSGKAFVDGHWRGLTYQVGNLHCVELHTSTKSALILTPAGLDVAKEMAGFLPLP